MDDIQAVVARHIEDTFAWAKADGCFEAWMRASHELHGAMNLISRLGDDEATQAYLSASNKALRMAIKAPHGTPEKAKPAGRCCAQRPTGLAVPQDQPGEVIIECEQSTRTREPSIDDNEEAFK